MKDIKNNKNGKQVIDSSTKASILPPSLSDGVIKGPKKLESIGDIIREQQRLYKMVFNGDLALNDLSKLMYSLQNIIQGLKAKSEIDALEDAYIKQWQGVRIIAPEGAEIPDPMKHAIEGEILDAD